MAYFVELEGDAAVLLHRGIYRQCPLYTRDGYLYAKYGAGFVKLCQDGSTSLTGLRVDALITEATLTHDRFGRLTLAPSAKALTDG